MSNVSFFIFYVSRWALRDWNADEMGETTTKAIKKQEDDKTL
jgi:hypothetical protein